MAPSLLPTRIVAVGTSSSALTEPLPEPEAKAATSGARAASSAALRRVAVSRMGTSGSMAPSAAAPARVSVPPEASPDETEAVPSAHRAERSLDATFSTKPCDAPSESAYLTTMSSPSAAVAG